MPDIMTSVLIAKVPEKLTKQYRAPGIWCLRLKIQALYRPRRTPYKGGVK